MILKHNKIEFTPRNQEVETLVDPNTITPAKKALPLWYKNIKRVSSNSEIKKKSCPFNSDPNTTVKNCIPFFDSMTSGYSIILDRDIQFTKLADNVIYVNTRIDVPDLQIIEKHHKDSAAGVPPCFHADNLLTDDVFKWLNPYCIKTPAGYSTLFTHPLNRHDLPFRCFTGIVDTDTYTDAVNFPFQLSQSLQENDVLIIEAGTPIIQLIPFKREPWKSKICKFDLIKYKKSKLEYFKKIVDAYKSRYWHKKIYI